MALSISSTEQTPSKTTFFAAAAKYGKEPNEADVILGDGVDAEIAARPKEFGNTVEDVIKFRDKIFAVILKEYGKL